MLKNRDEGIKAEKLGGSGKGCAMRFPIDIPDNDGAFVMTTRLELEPGASIGYHLHGDNEEVYFIMSGEGLYCEDGRKPQGKGRRQSCSARKGCSHGIENTGADTLVMGSRDSEARIARARRQAQNRRRRGKLRPRDFFIFPRHEAAAHNRRSMQNPGKRAVNNGAKRRFRRFCEFTRRERAPSASLRIYEISLTLL